MINAILATVVLSIALTLFYHSLKPQDAQQEREPKKKRKSKKLKAKYIPEIILARDDPKKGVYAAIASAIHLYGEELHDVENTVLTINKVSRTYSPWSSKIHGLNTYYFRLRR